MALRRTTILADADLLERLDRYARRTGWTKTAIVTAALEAWLRAEAGPPRDPPFVAVGRSGHGRLSLDARPIAATEAGRREPARPPRPARPAEPAHPANPGPADPVGPGQATG